MNTLSSRDRALLVATVSLYATSLFLPAFKTAFDAYPPEGHTVQGGVDLGIEVLMYGWAGILTLSFGWYANPLFFAALLYFMKGNPISSLLARLSLILAFSTLIHTDLGSDKGIPAEVSSFGSGFYVWLSSISLLTVLAAFKFDQEGK